MKEVSKCQVVVWLCLSVIWPLYHLIHFRVELSKRVDHLSVTACTCMCMYSMYVCVCMRAWTCVVVQWIILQFNCTLGLGGY